MIILPFLFITGIFQMIGTLIAGADPTDYGSPKTPCQDMVISLFTLGGTFLTVYIFRRNIDNESFRSLGFSSFNMFRESFIGIIMGFLIITAGSLLMLFFHEIDLIRVNIDVKNLIFSVFIFIAVAVSEELFVRGYILNNLMKSMSPMPALLVSSAIFSIFHLFNPHYSWLAFLDILLAGLLLGLPYIYTRRLWLPIALHFSWNFFQGPIFGFSVSGQETYSLISQSRVSDTLLNGGAFGFEGSIFSLVFQLIAILFLLRFYRKKKLA